MESEGHLSRLVDPIGQTPFDRRSGHGRRFHYAQADHTVGKLDFEYSMDQAHDPNLNKLTGGAEDTWAAGRKTKRRH